MLHKDALWFIENLEDKLEDKGYFFQKVIGKEQILHYDFFRSWH